MVISSLSSAWQQRSAREKYGLFAVPAAVVAVVLFLLLEPLVDERRRLSAELPRLRDDLAWMESHVGQARQLNAPAVNGGTQAVSAARVEALLQEAGMRQQVSAMQPLPEPGLLLSFNEVDFADLLVFVSRLQDEGYARVSGARVSGTDAYNGRVTAELKLLPR